MWIESHSGLGEHHPKVARSADWLETSPIVIIGALHMLWWWAAQHRPDGDMSGLTPAQISELCGWTAFYDSESRYISRPAVDRAPEMFVNVLLAAPWIDCLDYQADPDGCPTLDAPLPAGAVIHNWLEYSKKRLDAVKRTRDWRANKRLTPTK